MSELYSLVQQLWLVWLAVLFLGIVLWVMWPGRREKWEAAARIPFEEDGDDGR